MRWKGKAAFLWALALHFLILCVWTAWRYNPKPILTLFISMKPDEHRDHIHVRTLQQLSSLQPAVHLVLMSSSGYPWLNELAKNYGWDVVHMQTDGPPKIRTMFQTVMTGFDSHFYGFSNADILFGEDLVLTLQLLMRHQYHNGLLVVGRRHNIDADVMNSKDLALSEWKAEASMFGSDAQDYFITTRDGFPWDKVPNLVIGRPGYDNWLVTQALVWGLDVVDVTTTVFALHQTGTDGNYAGAKATDKDWNTDLIGKYNYFAGRTSCAQWMTSLDYDGEIQLVKRPERARPANCRKANIGYNVNVDAPSPAPNDPNDEMNVENEISDAQQPSDSEETKTVVAR